MGKVLQIRVTAVTWNEELVEEYWPRLVRLAGTVPVKSEGRGVLELVRRLDEGLRFMKWSEARKQAMGPGIREAARLKAELEAALADWDPRKANGLSDDLEDALDALERAYTE